MMAVGLLIFFHSFNILSPVENIIYKIFKPIQSSSASVALKINNFFGYFGNVGNLIEENKKLKDKTEVLLVENTKLKIALDETKILTEEKNFLNQQNYNSVLTRVIGKSPDPNIHSIIIDKGSSQGIKEGQAVISGQGILVGKVSEVQNEISKILLITDSQSKTSVIVQNEKTSQGIISGEYGISLKIELIPQDDLIAPGQYVISSGLETGIPKGLIIGQIDRVIKKPGDLFQSATVRPLQSLDNLAILSIIL